VLSTFYRQQQWLQRAYQRIHQRHPLSLLRLLAAIRQLGWWRQINCQHTAYMLEVSLAPRGSIGRRSRHRACCISQCVV
jgi:hypothetical protein